MSKTISRERTLNYIGQIKASFVFKGLAVTCSFFSMPLMIHYLGQEQFGVWSTLLSVMLWMTFFDFGLGHGLRNTLAESLAKGQTENARSLISSAYSLIGLISFILFSILAIAAFIVPWQKVFNTHLLNNEILSHVVLLTGFFVALNFWASLINSVLNAVQKTSVVVLGQFLTNALSLLFVYFLTKTTHASLLYLAMVYGTSIIGANALLSAWFYKRNLSLIPNISKDFSHIRPLLGLGLQFFVIQLAVLVIFTTDKILITQLFGPGFVTSYDVVFKLFGIVTLVYGQISAPLWSSYTDAFHRGDMTWITGILKKQLLIFGLVFLAILLLVLTAKSAIKLWIGSELVISMPLVLSVGILITITTWNNIYSMFLNGIGKIRLQLYLAVFAMVLNIPLAIYFTKHLGFGVEGIVLATCVSQVFFAVIGPIETYSVLKNKV